MKSKAYDPGVYAIICVASGKFYIGSSINVARRMKVHARELNAGSHGNRKLQRTWNKYGALSFHFKKLFGCAEELLLQEEQACMDCLQPQFNLAPVAGSGRGVVWTKDAVARIIGRKLPDSVRLSMIGNKRGAGVKKTQHQLDVASRTHKGKTVSVETREKISRAKKGFVVSEETRVKCKERMMGNDFAKGKRWSEERRKAHAIRVAAWWGEKRKVL